MPDLETQAAMQSDNDIADIFDIDTKTLADEGVWLHLEHPTTGEKLYSGGIDRPVRIKMLGTDSDKFREMAAKNEAKKAQHRMRNQGIVPPAIEYALDLELVTQMSIAWENINHGGTAMQFHVENVKALYRRQRWIFDQVNAFAASRANFLRNGKGA